MASVWRPLDRPVVDYPLGICDGKTVKERDMYECDVVRVRFIGGTVYIAHDEEQKWHYLSNQDPSEVLLLKMFDSYDDVVKGKDPQNLQGFSLTRCIACPHGAFLHPDAPSDAPKRKSIEVRALVFTHPNRFVPEI